MSSEHVFASAADVRTLLAGQKYLCDDTLATIVFLATRLGKPSGFRISINEVYGSAGAGFVVAKTGEIMTMPGLPSRPAAWDLVLSADGKISGLR